MILDRTIAPAIHDAIEFDYNLPPINRVKMDNQLPLYWLNAGVQDVVEIDWVFPSGLWQEPKQALAQTTAALIKSGTSKHTAQQLNESIEFYGANVKVNAGNDFSTLTLFCLTRDLPHLLPIIHEILTDATFPETEVALYKQNAIQRLLVNLRKCEFVANQKIDTLLYGADHPYGRFSQQDKIEALTRDDVAGFYREAYDLSKAQIFMAGKVGEPEVVLINQLFGQSSAINASIAEKEFSIPAMGELKHKVMNDAEGVQAAIRVGRIFPNRQHPDFAGTVVLNTLFGGYFGSRLMSNIREDKGFTYGIYSSITPYAHGGEMTIHTEVGRDVADAAIHEIYLEMEKLRQETASEDELLLVKNYLLGGLLGDLDGPFELLKRWRTLILSNQDEQNFYKNIITYKTVTPEILKELAIKYYDASSFYEVVVI